LTVPPLSLKYNFPSAVLTTNSPVERLNAVGTAPGVLLYLSWIVVVLPTRLADVAGTISELLSTNTARSAG
jgi:hypothetical protein